MLIFCLILHRDGKFSSGNAFVGFQMDTPAAIIFQATNFLRKLKQQDLRRDIGWETIHSANALCGATPEEFLEMHEDSREWKQAVSYTQEKGYIFNYFTGNDIQVLKLSQYYLLQTASPDAMVRLQKTSLARESEVLQQIYYGRQHHSSLDNFLAYHLKFDGNEQPVGKLLQV